MQPEEILIVGAGPTGMALGAALAQAGRRATLLDARPRGAWVNDKRVLALSHGSRQILERLGAWRAVEATPIESIHVSQRGGFGSAMLHARDYGVPALGHVASAASVAGALDARLAELGVQVVEQADVADIVAHGDEVTVHLRDGARRTARLVALAEGAIGADTENVGGHDYAQHAVICAASVRGSHRNLAFERFTAHGPVALLPYGRDYAVVFTAPAGNAQALLDQDDAQFLTTLQAAIGERVQLTGCSPRARYPLVLRYRREPVGQRTVWLGNAAQTLHPVAGQGFNLALRDVWELATQIADARGGDPGSPVLLGRYVSARRADRFGVIGFTDTLIRVFSNEHPLLRAARGGGLAALELLPPLKHFVAKRMMFGARAWP